MRTWGQGPRAPARGLDTGTESPLHTHQPTTELRSGVKRTCVQLHGFEPRVLIKFFLKSLSSPRGTLPLLGRPSPHRCHFSSWHPWPQKPCTPSPQLAPSVGGTGCVSPAPHCVLSIRMGTLHALLSPPC